MRKSIPPVPAPGHSFRRREPGRAVRRVLLSGGTTLVLGMQVGGTPSAAEFPAVLRLSSLDGANGFVINGINGFAGGSGFSVSDAGDVNGDGVADLLISTPYAFGDGERFSGESYVVFGGAGVGSTGVLELSDRDGANGFVIDGIDRDDLSGWPVSGAGDVNGDGVDDLLIGAPVRFSNGNEDAGASYVVFGGGDVGGAGVLNLSALGEADGFVIDGADRDDLSGRSVSDAGDVNGDGVDDLLIGAPGRLSNGNENAGASYVVFGGSGVGRTGVFELSDLDGADGFVIDGVDGNGQVASR